MFLRLLIIGVGIFYWKNVLAQNTIIESFQQAKQIALNQIYFDHLETFYCHGHIDPITINVQPPSEFTTTQFKNRQNKLEWEHVVPAENFGRNFSEWTQGHPKCTDRHNKSYRGRKCADKVSRAYRYIQSDLYNLYPAIGSVNAMRSNYPYAELPNAEPTFSGCSIKIHQHYVEPPEYTKGEIARTYLYMDAVYPEINLDTPTRDLMHQWNQLYPVSPWECIRAERIHKIQGNINLFVKNKCLNTSSNPQNHNNPTRTTVPVVRFYQPHHYLNSIGLWMYYTPSLIHLSSILSQ